jgi:hypothetical protein
MPSAHENQSDVTTEDADVGRSLKGNSVLRLLLTLVGFEEEREGGNSESDDEGRNEDEDGNPIVRVWTVPGGLSRIKLEGHKELIENFVENPAKPEGKDALKVSSFGIRSRSVETLC